MRFADNLIWAGQAGEDRAFLPYQWYAAELGDQRLLALAAVDRGLEAGSRPYPAQVLESPDVSGEQVVADDAPVLGPISADDRMIVRLGQPGTGARAGREFPSGVRTKIWSSKAFGVRSRLFGNKAQRAGPGSSAGKFNQPGKRGWRLGWSIGPHSQGVYGWIFRMKGPTV